MQLGLWVSLEAEGVLIQVVAVGLMFVLGEKPVEGDLMMAPTQEEEEVRCQEVAVVEDYPAAVELEASSKLLTTWAISSPQVCEVDRPSGGHCWLCLYRSTSDHLAACRY